MPNFLEDNDDLRFYLEKGIDWEPIVRLTEYDWHAADGPESVEEATELYTDILRMIGEFSAERIAPRAAELDHAHPKLVDGEAVSPPFVNELFEQMAELGLHGMCVPRELGGMSCPMLVYMMQIELLARADVSIAAHHSFHGGMAMAALIYSILEGSTTFDRQSASIVHTRFADAITEIVEGRAWGSMDITEPSAGSDMAALRTRAVQDDQGQWRVTGEKIFITSGHGKYHFLIARTEQTDDTDAFAGLKGLSMFLVPAYTEDDSGEKTWLATLEKVEEKLGHNASATVAIRFDDTPAHLIGERGEGFKYMLLLMNNARIGVGFESLGLCEAAYRQAKRYASERPSMGKTIDRHEMIADMLDEMRTDIQALRAMTVHAGVHEELAQKLRLQLRFWPPEDADELARLERRMKRHKRRARELTPLLKYFAAEKAVEMARRNIQIHGGAGYITEYGAEKLLRDAMVMPIYEGTSQIQALMAMKDNLLEVVRDPKRFVRETARARWRSLSARDPLDRRIAKLQSIKYATLQFLISRLATGKLKELRHHSPKDWSHLLTGWDPKRDFSLAMLHAERLTRILIDVTTAEELYDQARKHPERTELLERWLERAEPRCRFYHDEITTTGLRLLRALDPSATEEHAHAAK